MIMKHRSQKLSVSEKVLLAGATLCSVAVIVLEALGLAGIFDFDLTNLIVLPLLGTAALLCGIQNLHRSKTVPSVLTTAIFDFVTAAIIYIGSIVLIFVHMTA